MLKIQTHCHLKGSSRCAHATSDELIEDLLKEGFDGAVITNHYCYNYFINYPCESNKEKLDCYFNIINEFEEKAKKVGLKSFYGSEVQIYLPDGLYADYVIYGFEPKFLYDNKPLYEYGQKELFALCDKNNVMLYQAHPFRKGITIGDPKYMHGAEYFNGHVNHYNNNNLAREFCDKYNLVKMSGCDYHDKGQPLLGGIYVPDTVKNNIDLTDCIINGDYQIIDYREKYMELTTKKEQIK